jgi:hypothetical protein
MEDNIYKAMPVLNRLGIDVNKYAPDNNALMFAKALAKIGAGVAEQYKTSEFNSKVAQINQLELKFKNEVLVNKDIDLQDPVKREQIFKIANEVTEKQKELILNYKYLDGEDIQKLEGILYKKTGERAFNLQNDTNKIMIKQATDNAIATIEELKTQGEAIDYQDKALLENIYGALPEEYQVLKASGVSTKEVQKYTSEAISKIEGSVTSKYLNNVLIKSGAYDTIPLKRQKLDEWYKENVSDEALENKVNEITKNYPEAVDTEEREYLKSVLKNTYDIEYTKANSKIYDLEVDYSAQVRSEKAALQAANITATALREQIAAEQLRAARDKATDFFTSNNLRGIVSMRNGSPSTHKDVLRDSFLIEATGMDRRQLINGTRENKYYIDSFEESEIGNLKALKETNRANGLNDYDFYKANIERLTSGTTTQEQELIYRELHVKGVIDYNTVKLASGKNETEKRKIFGITKVMETGRKTNPNYDMAVLPTNDKLRVLIDDKFRNSPAARSMFIDYYSGLNQENQLPGNLRLKSGNGFLTSLGVAARRNDDLYNDMVSKADYFIRLAETNSFTKATYNTGIIDIATNNEAGIITNIKTPRSKGSAGVRAKSQEGLTSKSPKWHKEPVPPKPAGATKNKNTPSTQQGKALGGI